MQNQEVVAADRRVFKREGWKISQEPREMILCICRAEHLAGHLAIKGELEVRLRLTHNSQFDQGNDLFVATLRITAEECGRDENIPYDVLAVSRSFQTLSSIRFWLFHTEAQIIGLLFHNIQGHFHEREVMRVLFSLADQTKKFDERITQDAGKRRELFDTFRQASAERC